MIAARRSLTLVSHKQPARAKQCCVPTSKMSDAASDKDKRPTCVHAHFDVSRFSVCQGRCYYSGYAVRLPLDSEQA